MSSTRGISAVRFVGAVLAAGLLVGCASTTASPRTVIVTETAAPITDTVSSLPVTGVETSSGSDATSTSSVTMAPIVTVDPLKADCAVIMNPTELGKVFGTLPAGADRVTEGGNPDRKLVGKLKCHYGVSADGSKTSVSVVLAQFESEQAATSQISTTIKSEKGAGATASTTTVQGHPADILIRDGGLLVVGYDTWTLSVVVDSSVLAEDALPAALTAIADHALTAIIG